MQIQIQQHSIKHSNDKVTKLYYSHLQCVENGEESCEIDEDELLGELEGMDDNGATQTKIAKLKEQIQSETMQGSKQIKAGNREQALVHVRRKKQLEQELQALEAAPSKPSVQVVKPPLVVSKQQDVEEQDLELDEKYHDVDMMPSVTVIEHELEFLRALIPKVDNQDEREYFESKVDALDFKKG